MAKTKTDLNPKVVDMLKAYRAKREMMLEQLLRYAAVKNAESYVIQLDFDYLPGQAAQLSVQGTRAKKGACENET